MSGDFRNFVARMRRLYGKFAYFRVTEYKAEKYHLHVLVRSGFIPIEIIRTVWYEVSGYPIAYVESVYSPNIAGYLVKDLYKDMTSYGWSQDWVFPGFVKLWKKVKRLSDGDIKKSIFVFEKLLKNYSVQKELVST